MRKILITMLITLFLIGIVTASSFGIYKQNECVDLVITCDNCTYVNISSIEYPNSSKAVLNVITTNDSGVSYNYTYCDTSELGQYNVRSFGDDDGIISSSEDYFEITPTGHNLNTSKSIISLVGVGIMIIVFILFLTLATVFTHTGTRIFFLGLALTTIVFIVGYVLKIQQDTVGEFISFTSIFSSFYTLLTILLIGASVALMLYLIVFAFKSFYSLRGYYD